MFDAIRFSKHFVLLDFMADRDVYTFGRPLGIECLDPVAERQGQLLCTELLEPLVAQFGPCSVAAGFWPEVCRSEGGHHASSPHMWNAMYGAAADVAFHDWVNAERAPIKLCEIIDKEERVVFDRLITYSGSEFICMAHKANAPRYAIHESIHVPGAARGQYRTLGSDARQRLRRRNYVWPERADWRRIAGEPVQHSNWTLRAQHIRVGRYFVLLDFCHSSEGVLRGICTVPPLDAEEQISYARMFAEVLDPVVAAFGRVSVIRGMEPRGLARDEWAGHHRWRREMTEDGKARVVFLLPQGVDPDDAMDVLEQHTAVLDMRADWHPSETFSIAVLIDRFDPAHQWSSSVE